MLLFKFTKPDSKSDFPQVMDSFQEKLLNNDFELIATELFNDDPKLQIESLKVGFKTKLSISAKRVEVLTSLGCMVKQMYKLVFAL